MFAYVGRNQNLKDLKDRGQSKESGRPWKNLKDLKKNAQNLSVFKNLGVSGGFQGVSRRAPILGENVLKTELNDVSQMWVWSFEVRLGTSRTFRLATRNRGFGGHS